ncbi:hypothetical protein AC579_1148 [Pseudocercospora musae]|uniref:Uncharacterized protein n=1 Tax=Pseudocercospora musae TaxID=113226 RepID=A0A139H490_9PEZI|nr:hypothetical protein AC579_1148 [Pseudocercospora musae]
MLHHPDNFTYASGYDEGLPHAVATTFQTPSGALISPMLFQGEQRPSRSADHLRSGPGIDANKAFHRYQIPLYSSLTATSARGQPHYTAQPAWQSPPPAFATSRKSDCNASRDFSSSVDPLAHPWTPAPMLTSAQRSPQPAKLTYTSSQAFQTPPRFLSSPALLQAHTKLVISLLNKPMPSPLNKLILASHTRSMATLPNKLMVRTHARLRTTMLNKLMLQPHTKRMTTLVNKLIPTLLNKPVTTLPNNLGLRPCDSLTTTLLLHETQTQDALMQNGAQTFQPRKDSLLSFLGLQLL